MKDTIETRIMKLRAQKYSGGTTQALSKADEDGKPRTVGGRVLIGNVNTDRADIVAKEFDLLFGVDGFATSSSSDIPERVSSNAI